MSAPERIHAFDAARVFALLLGIVLHATMSFFLVIPARDTSQSTTLAVTFYVIHTFRMTLFFLIAGFLGRMAFHRRGARGFIKERAKRILVPLTAGWLLLAPLTIGVVIWGLTRTFADAPAAGANDALQPQGLPLTHLWFLYYLSIFYVLALVLRGAFIAAVDRGGTVRARIDRAFGATIRAHVAPLVLAVPTFAILHLTASWPVWFGIPTPDTGLLPKPTALVAFGAAFFLGWLLHRQSPLLKAIERQWRTNLALAVALTATCLVLIGPAPSLTAPTAIDGGVAMRLVYAGCYSLSIWCWTFGLLGVALRFFAHASPVRRYLADASYFLYLAHLPVVFALQVLVMNVPLHWAVKFPLIVVTTLTLLLVIYHYLVRPTFVGELLNGPRNPRGKHLPVATSESSVSEPDAEPSSNAITSDAAAIAELTGVTKRFGNAVALDGISLAVRPGELLAVLGANGAGKSTAIGLWLGTLQPDDGRVTLLGGGPGDVHSRLAVGVLMQEVELGAMLTAREHIELTASCYREPLSVEETIALTGIESLADKRYGKLSAGQKRQVQFATAICGKPRLLFLDEPTVGLDVEAREALWRNIRRLVQGGCAVVLTTHYLEEAEALADRVAVLGKGKLIAEGTVEAMRAVVTRKRISCASSLAVEDIRQWPGVVEVMRDDHVVRVTASDAETVVRRLLASDATLSHLEVKQASLAEAFTELTKEAA